MCTLFFLFFVSFLLEGEVNSLDLSVLFCVLLCAGMHEVVGKNKYWKKTWWMWPWHILLTSKHLKKKQTRKICSNHQKFLTWGGKIVSGDLGFNQLFFAMHEIENEFVCTIAKQNYSRSICSISIEVFLNQVCCIATLAKPYVMIKRLPNGFVHACMFLCF